MKLYLIVILSVIIHTNCHILKITEALVDASSRVQGTINNNINKIASAVTGGFQFGFDGHTGQIGYHQETPTSYQNYHEHNYGYNYDYNYNYNTGPQASVQVDQRPPSVSHVTSNTQHSSASSSVVQGSPEIQQQNQIVQGQSYGGASSQQSLPDTMIHYVSQETQNKGQGNYGKPQQIPQPQRPQVNRVPPPTTRRPPTPRTTVGVNRPTAATNVLQTSPSASLGLLQAQAQGQSQQSQSIQTQPPQPQQNQVSLSSEPYINNQQLIQIPSTPITRPQQTNNSGSKFLISNATKRPASTTKASEDDDLPSFVPLFDKNKNGDNTPKREIQADQADEDYGLDIRVKDEYN